MRHYADVLNPEGVKRPRIRRPRTVRIVVLNPGDPPPRRRINPHGWRFANESRRRQGRKKAWQMLVLRLGGYRVNAIAQMLGTTTGAVYQQLYRLRSGFYDRARAVRGAPPQLRIEYVYETARAPEPDR
jgi:hypothetical protein